MKSAIKVVLIIFLAGCLFHLPYGYYQFARIIVCAGFAWLAYTEFEDRRPVFGVLCVLIAMLFNPVIKVYLARDTWHVMDIAIGVLLSIWIIVDLVSLRNGKSI